MITPYLHSYLADLEDESIDPYASLMFILETIIE